MTVGGTLTLVGFVPIRGELSLVGWVSIMMANVDPVGRDSSIRVGLSGSSLVGIAPTVGSGSRKLGSRLNDENLP